MRYLLAIVLMAGFALPVQAHRWEVYDKNGTYVGIYNGNPGPGWSFGRIYNEELDAFYYLGGTRDSPLRWWQHGFYCASGDCTGECYAISKPTEDWPPPQGIFAVGGVPVPSGFERSQTVVVTGPSLQGFPLWNYSSRYDGNECLAESGFFAGMLTDRSHGEMWSTVSVRVVELPQKILHALDNWPFHVVSVDEGASERADMLRRMEALEAEVERLRQEAGR